MINRLKSAYQTFMNQESFESRIARIKPGIIFSVIGTTVYVLAFAVINPILFPDLHLGMDWGWLGGTWFGTTLAIVLAAIIAGWPTENYVGIAGGGVVMTILLLVFNIIMTIVLAGNASSISQVFVTTLPLVGVCILLALVLRWVMNRQQSISQEESAYKRRYGPLRLVGIMFAIGLVPAILSTYDPSDLDMLRLLNKRLLTTATPDVETVRFPENVAAEVSRHYGTPFTLYPHASSMTLNALDTKIRFTDGFAVSCLLPTDSSQFLVIPQCDVVGQPTP
jgi:hypothetical protein